MAISALLLNRSRRALSAMLTTGAYGTAAHGIGPHRLVRVDLRLTGQPDPPTAVGLMTVQS
jgi:hypothetical protein